MSFAPRNCKQRAATVRMAAGVLIGLLFLTFKGSPVEASGQGGLAVTVTDSAGTPVKGAKVVVSLPAGSAILEAQTSTSGTAAFERLRAARYRVTVAPPASMALAGDVLLGSTGELPGAEVTIRPGEVTRLERKLSPAGIIQVRFTRAGVPWLPDCACTLEVSATGVFDPRPPDLDATSLLVRGLPVRNDYRVLFKADGYATQEQVSVAVTGGQTTAVTFEYDPDNPTGLAGFVRDEQGAPVSGFQVVAYAEEPAPLGTPAGSSRSDANGRYSIVGLKPGAYRLHGFVGGSLAFGTVQTGSTTTVNVIARASGGTASLRSAGAQAAGAESEPPPAWPWVNPPNLRRCGSMNLIPQTDPLVGPAMKDIIDGIREGLPCLQARAPKRAALLKEKVDRDVDYFKSFRTPTLNFFFDCNIPDELGSSTCAWTPSLAGAPPNSVYLAKDPRACGCRSSIIFHELLHLSSTGPWECITYRCTKECFACARDVPASSFNQHTGTEDCAKVPVCCDSPSGQQ